MVNSLVITLVNTLFLTLVIKINIISIIKVTDNLILWQLQKVNDALTKSKDEHTLILNILPNAVDKINTNSSSYSSAKITIITPGSYKLSEIAEIKNNKSMVMSE